MTGSIDPTSEALGRIEANIGNLEKQNDVLFKKIDALNTKVEDLQKNGCVSGREVCTSSKGQSILHGSLGASLVVSVIEVLKYYMGGSK